MGADIKDTVGEAIERASGAGPSEESREQSRLNTMVALLVAISATFMALCNVKDGNVVQAMSAAQVSGADAWSYFQAKSTKQALAEAMLDQMLVQKETAQGLPPDAREKLDARIDAYKKNVARYEAEKADIRRQAEDFQKTYDELNVHDDQLDMAEAAFSISIALFGVTALTHKRWLFFIGLGFALFGGLFGLAGFLKWGLHPDFVAKLLG